jgi:uncharacterized protein
LSASVRASSICAMNIVRLGDSAPHAWRNGGGSTRELLAWPLARATSTDWQLRVSVATIAHSGAFSAFADVQRWFAVIAGAGVSLALPGGVVMQKQGDPPLCFEGEAAPMCHLLDDATSDLNLMLHRDAGSGRMELAHAGDELAGPLRWRGLYVAADAVLEVEGVALPLHAGSLIWSDNVDGVLWRLRSIEHNSRAWWLSLESR